MDNELLLKMTDIQKSFNHVRAVRNGQLEIYKGEIHGLIGENGAGTVSYTHLDVYKRQAWSRLRPIDPGRAALPENSIFQNALCCLSTTAQTPKRADRLV